MHAGHDAKLHSCGVSVVGEVVRGMMSGRGNVHLGEGLHRGRDEVSAHACARSSVEIFVETTTGADEQKGVFLTSCRYLL